MTKSGAIVVCADDYAFAPATSATIRDLLERGCINATTCLVETAHWSADGEQLRRLAQRKPTIGVGLHLNLTEAFQAPQSASPIKASRLLLDPSEAFASELRCRFVSQWRAFADVIGRAPDFVDGHQHVHLAPAARRALFQLLADVGFRGWLRQCRTSSSRTGVKRLMLDGLSDAFRQRAGLSGWPCNPGFGGLRSFRTNQNIEAEWRRDLSAMSDGGLLMVHPGADTDGDPIGKCRRQEARALSAGAVACALEALGLAIAADARSPW